MKKNIYAWVLKTPLLLIFLASFIASIYASWNKIAGVTYASSVILGIAFILYIVGEAMIIRGERQRQQDYYA